MSQIDLKIGPKIKAFRRQLGLQANKLSEQLGISPSYLNLIESGKRKIDGDLLLKVCEELKIELTDLTNKSDLNLANNLSELLGDELFEDLDILELLFRKFHPKVILDYSKEFGVSSRYDELKIKIDNFKFDNNNNASHVEPS